MEAWYIDSSKEDQRLPHHLDPPQYVTNEELARLGVLHWVLDADAYESDPELKQIRKERGYDYEVCPPLHVWTFNVCGLDSLKV
jgi:1,2-dihydroxy-3-keto-5-methylthiopentene dioxygenase